ncbi:response regulator transcription factor [Candidatus Rhodoluna planktonica]|jgi:DNA-binding NarL/FixJ family response regulator|nr:response regulator transcription factor [Candidatus Rhodoluna planktonica]
MAWFNRKILLVEDEPLLRGLIAANLELEQFEVATASNAAEARKIAETFDPDIAVLDIELGAGPNGVDLAIVLRRQFPEIALVFLTHIPEPRITGIDNRSIPKNAAYLVKDRMADPGVLREAIEAAVRNRVSEDFRDDKRTDHRFTELSKAQLGALKMIALGMSNHQIAAERGTTVRAVENLVKRAFEAAGIADESGVNQRVAAAREFIKVAGLPLAK